MNNELICDICERDIEDCGGLYCVEIIESDYDITDIEQEVSKVNICTDCINVLHDELKNEKA